MSRYWAKLFFEKHDDPTQPQKLLGLELRITDNTDPCEMFFDDYRQVNGQMIPHKIHVRYVNSEGYLVPYGNITVKNIQWK